MQNRMQFSRLLPLAVVLGFLQASVLGQVVVEDVSFVDVSTTGFSVVWQGTPEALPSVSVFSDASGTEEITDELAIVSGPIGTGDRDATSAPDAAAGEDAIRAASAAFGVQRVSIEGLAPGTTYHVRLRVELDGAPPAVWPEGDLATVTTSSSSAFVVDVKQLVVDLSGETEVEPLGWVVHATHPDASYGVSAVVGDGAAVTEAVLNLANLVASSGEGWVPAGVQQLTITILRGSDLGSLEEDVTLDFSSEFQVVSRDRVEITDRNDTDRDGMEDDWEREFFGTLARDGTGDFDGDGLKDRDEFNGGSNPLVSNIPIVPQAYRPAYGAEVDTLRPQLIAYRRTDKDPRDYAMEFEIFDSSSPGEPVAAAYVESPADQSFVAFEPESELADNSWFEWRVRWSDGYSYSRWVYSRFFVNLGNDAPGPFRQSYPRSGAQVDTLTPTFEVTNSVDPDGDQLEYRVEIRSANGAVEVATISGVQPGPDGRTRIPVEGALEEGSYSWRAVVTDEHGAETSTDLSPFSIDLDNGAPTTPTIVAPALGDLIEETEVDLVVEGSTDPEGSGLSYWFEIDTAPTFDGPALTSSEAIEEAAEGATSWKVRELLDGQKYYWRAQSDDGAAQSEWVYGEFRVSLANRAPPVPIVANPGADAWIGSRSPTLEVFDVEDPDGDAVTYRFELFSDFLLLEPVAAEVSATPDWSVPLTLDEDTWYFWTCRAEDSRGASSERSPVSGFFVNTRIEQPPVADAGEDQNVLIEDLVILDGSASSDPRGRLLSYLWSFSANPGTSEFLDPGDPKPIFIPDAEGVYRVRLEVSNGVLSDLSEVRIFAGGSTPPNADAGRHRDVLTGERVSLDGSRSNDPDGAPGPLTFQWSFAILPDASALTNADISNADSARASFVTDVDGVYLLRLRVTDGLARDSDLLILRASSSDVPPNAFAGDDASIELGETADLDGTGSADPDGSPEPLTYSWRFVSLPVDSALTDGSITDADSALATFTPDAIGTFVLRLEVSDGLYRAFDQVAVTVGEPTMLPFKFVRGDSNNDGGADLSDAIYILNFLFTGGPGFVCPEAADVNDDGPVGGIPSVDLSDGVYLLNHLFTGGPPPAAPYPDCGIDPTGGLCEVETICGV